jgi:hypothetical protein
LRRMNLSFEVVSFELGNHRVRSWEWKRRTRGAEFDGRSRLCDARLGGQWGQGMIAGARSPPPHRSEAGLTDQNIDAAEAAGASGNDWLHPDVECGVREGRRSAVYVGDWKS